MVRMCSRSHRVDDAPLQCEIVRILKMTGSNSIEPLSFIVPRKSDSFQEDIFPDCISGEPAQSAADYFGAWDLRRPPLPARALNAVACCCCVLLRSRQECCP